MFKKEFAAFIFSLLALFNCLIDCQEPSLTIISYNVNNLFDTVKNGTEYRDFDPSQGKWNDDSFQKRLGQISQALLAACPTGAELILLQEIENRNVLEALLNQTPLKDLGYRYYLATPQPTSATTVGLLSKLPVLESRIHSQQVLGQEPQREILEVTIRLDDEIWLVFNSHWKSKKEGALKTEAQRLATASLILKRLEEINRTQDYQAIILAGDFNESHDEYLRVNRSYQTALVPASALTDFKALKGSILLVAEPAQACFNDCQFFFYEPWFTCSSEPLGSFWYGGEWGSLDHILILFNNSHWQPKAFKAFAADFLLDPVTGAPLTYKPQRPERGFSDHLPLILTLKRR